MLQSYTVHCLSTKCEFNNFLEEALGDHFMCGVQTESTQEWLIVERNLSFVSMGAAEQDAWSHSEIIQLYMYKALTVFPLGGKVSRGKRLSLQ